MHFCTTYFNGMKKQSCGVVVNHHSIHREIKTFEIKIVKRKTFSLFETKKHYVDLFELRTSSVF